MFKAKQDRLLTRSAFGKYVYFTFLKQGCSAKKKTAELAVEAFLWSDTPCKDFYRLY
jgi:hypothetical protein